MTCENAGKRVSYFPLSPFGRETESHSNKAKPDNHVPSADIWDWETSLSYIEDYDPEEADQEISDHYRG